MAGTGGGSNRRPVSLPRRSGGKPPPPPTGLLKPVSSFIRHEFNRRGWTFPVQGENANNVFSKGFGLEAGKQPEPKI
jgi:hypothetical protein